MIEYIFKMDDDDKHTFKVDLERSLDESLDDTKVPQWTKLDFHQCGNCTLDGEECPYCPTALDVEEIVLRFKDIISYKKSNVIVRTPQRWYFKRCDVQSGLSSLLGLVMATSACPILSQLRGLAYYHLPFASEAETLFRVVGAHLLKQYYVHRIGGIPDIELVELSRLYGQLQKLNESFVGRIRAASELDANVNAILKLFTMSELISFSLEEKLESLKTQFFPL